MNAIEMKSVTKKYGKLKALDDANLTLPSGRIIGLLGKNGAGKSTMMRCLLGFLNFEGDIEIFGEPVKKHRIDHLKRIAFIPDVDGLDKRLTVEQTIKYVSGVNPAWNDQTAHRLLEKSNLPLKKKVSKLSKGMKTKLYLLVTLSLDVDVLLLDEPTLGLDIAFRKEFFNTILGEFFDENKTIIISTHQVEEVEHILQDIIFIDQGKIVLHDSVEDLKNRFSIVTVPTSQKEDLLNSSPKLITHSLGHISGIVNSDVQIENAVYNRPGLSDLFLAEVGGYDETV